MSEEPIKINIKSWHYKLACKFNDDLTSLYNCKNIYDYIFHVSLICGVLAIAGGLTILSILVTLSLLWIKIGAWLTISIVIAILLIAWLVYKRNDETRPIEFVKEE